MAVSFIGGENWSARRKLLPSRMFYNIVEEITVNFLLYEATDP